MQSSPGCLSQGGGSGACPPPGRNWRSVAWCLLLGAWHRGQLHAAPVVTQSCGWVGLPANAAPQPVPQAAGHELIALMAGDARVSRLPRLGHAGTPAGSPRDMISTPTTKSEQERSILRGYRPMESEATQPNRCPRPGSCPARPPRPVSTRPRSSGPSRGFVNRPAGPTPRHGGRTRTVPASCSRRGTAAATPD